MTLAGTSRPRKKLGAVLAAAIAAGTLLTGCGGDDDDGSFVGGGAGELTPPTEPSYEDAMVVSVDSWPPCEVMGEHVMEFVEAFDYVALEWAGDSELKVNNGSNTGGVKLCYQKAIWVDDPESEGLGDMTGEIMFGFASTNLESDGYTDQQYRTPRGRYDEQLALRREYINNSELEHEPIADRPIEGPWDEAVFLSYDALELTMDAFVLDVERGFMLSLSVGVGDPSDWDTFGDQVTWTLEEAKAHFLEVTVPNAYQSMVDRYDAAGAGG